MDTITEMTTATVTVTETTTVQYLQRQLTLCFWPYEAHHFLYRWLWEGGQFAGAAVTETTSATTVRETTTKTVTSSQFAKKLSLVSSQN